MSHVLFLISLIITEVELVCVYLLELSFSSSVTCLPIFACFFLSVIVNIFLCVCLAHLAVSSFGRSSQCLTYLGFPFPNTQLVLNECTHNCIIKALGITLHHSCHHYHHLHHHHYLCRFPRC